jgi:hypothetical protein
MVGGIIQFGILFWAQNTLTQVVRDTGRWEASQQAKPCSSFATEVAKRADSIASSASLIGYTAGQWTAATTYPTVPRPKEGVEVVWPIPTNDPPLEEDDCPPSSNATAWFVTIRLNHVIPTFFPGLQYLPGLGTCDSNGCSISISATTTFRMEPAPAK